MTNLNNAFEVAEKHLDIPKMLDAEGELFVIVVGAFFPPSMHLKYCVLNICVFCLFMMIYIN